MRHNYYYYLQCLYYDCACVPQHFIQVAHVLPLISCPGFWPLPVCLDCDYGFACINPVCLWVWSNLPYIHPLSVAHEREMQNKRTAWWFSVQVQTAISCGFVQQWRLCYTHITKSMTCLSYFTTRLAINRTFPPENVRTNNATNSIQLLTELKSSTEQGKGIKPSTCIFHLLSWVTCSESTCYMRTRISTR